MFEDNRQQRSFLIYFQAFFISFQPLHWLNLKSWRTKVALQTRKGSTPTFSNCCCCMALPCGKESWAFFEAQCKSWYEKKQEQNKYWIANSRQVEYVRNSKTHAVKKILAVFQIEKSLKSNHINCLQDDKSCIKFSRSTQSYLLLERDKSQNPDVNSVEDIHFLCALNWLTCNPFQLDVLQRTPKT